MSMPEIRPLINRQRGWAAWQSVLLRPWVKPLLVVLLSLPALWLFWRAFNDQLGANPAEKLIRNTGIWTLRMLCLTLLVTPLQQQFKLFSVVRYRRTLGLATFAYAVLHLLAYAWLDMALLWTDIWFDVLKRPFITVGMVAFGLLVPLALTSFNGAIRTLGALRWKQLHRAVYAVAVLAVLHFFWMRAAKQRFGEVAIYGAILALLLGWRVWRYVQHGRHLRHPHLRRAQSSD
jgi:sulfoxide reductase heme-binding subunit YedZ